jgi:putative Holliday junction resolvase
MAEEGAAGVAGSFRRGVRLALDWGKARIGVAACDADGVLAYPVETLDARAPLQRLRALVAEYEPLEIVVGLPRTLAGEEGLAAQQVRQQLETVAAALPGLSWRLLDERMSTVTASRRLQGAGRNTRRQRAVIDQAAAVAILEQALALERATGAPPGHPLVESTHRKDHDA